MKGRTSFTQDEVARIRELLNLKERALRSAQKGLRQKLRNMGFYITDFVSDQRGFTARDLERLLQTGAIRVV